jgi:LSD1 subclass zinc finger protein
MVKGPDGKLIIGTEDKDLNSKEALCWNCNTHLVYRNGAKKVRCYNCKEINDMDLNNIEAKELITCPNQKCQAHLLAPEMAYRIYCPTCNSIFVNPKEVRVMNKLEVLMNWVI